MKNSSPVFAGFSRPSSDFPAVRSELRAPPMYFELDLGTARSLANGTAARISRGGNVLYIDQKGNSGYATVHVQDDGSVGNCPITVFPGFLAKVPFTELMIENDAQPGQVMRFIYGTDLEFVPIPGGGVSVLNAINVNDVITPDCEVVSPALPTAIGADQVTVVLAPALNVSGVRVRSITKRVQAGAGAFIASRLLGSLVAPAAFGAQSNALHLAHLTITNSAEDIFHAPALNRVIPAGWGLYNITTINTAAALANTELISLERL